MVTRDGHTDHTLRQEQLALVDDRAAVSPRAAAMSEAQLLAAVRKLARLTGWLTYHCHDSRRSEPGFPDLVLAHHRQARVIYAELKTARGRLTAEQEIWLAALAAAGQEVAVWRPADLVDLVDLPTILRGDRRIDSTHTIELECERDRSFLRARTTLRRW